MIRRDRREDKRDFRRLRRWSALFVAFTHGQEFDIPAVDRNRFRASFSQWRNRFPQRTGLVIRTKTIGDLLRIKVIDGRRPRETSS